MTTPTAQFRNAVPARARPRILSWLLPDEPADRYRLYVALSAFLYIVAWTLVLVRAHVKHVEVDFAVSDAIGYYVYLPSIVIDGDLEFQNQLDVQFHGDPPPDFAKAMHRNRWPTGVALSIAPAFLAAHGLSHLTCSLTGVAALAPNGYTVLYFVFCVAWAMAISALGMIVADRLLVQRFGIRGPIAAAAVLTNWLGTHYLWYFVREPLIAHMLGASWVIFAIYLVHRIERTAQQGLLIWWHLPALALTTSMALTCRLTNAFLFPMFVYLLIVLIRGQLVGTALRLLPLILVALTPLAIQAYVTHRITGAVAPASMYDAGYAPNERFYWTQPALLRSLISSRHGLFFTTPALLLAAWGLARIWDLGFGIWDSNPKSKIRSDPLLTSLVLSATILWYLNSAWYAWWFGPCVGNRGFVELAGLFIIGFGFGYTRLCELRPRTRYIVLACMALCFLFNYALMGLKMIDKIEGNEYLIPAEGRLFTGRWERI